MAGVGRGRERALGVECGCQVEWWVLIFSIFREGKGGEAEPREGYSITIGNP
jgi:hypothetical protein